MSSGRRDAHVTLSRGFVGLGFVGLLWDLQTNRLSGKLTWVVPREKSRSRPNRDESFLFAANQMALQAHEIYQAVDELRAIASRGLEFAGNEYERER